MNTFALLLIAFLPILLIPFSSKHQWSILIAPVFSLGAAFALPVGSNTTIHWLLFGVTLGIDDVTQMFLLFTSFLWLIASTLTLTRIHKNSYSHRYRVFFMLAMAGNFGLIIAQDIVSFYLGFTLMGLATYGLIAENKQLNAQLAARRYLIWTIVGELIIFSAMVMLVFEHGAAIDFRSMVDVPVSNLTIFLIITGFSIKLALPGLHFWLPGAYAMAPTATVIVLSGAMMKAGLLGWLQFLPLGSNHLSGWGYILIGTGLVGIIYGSFKGLIQTQLRVLLGYSSISKMATLTTGVGIILVDPTNMTIIISALVLYATHHALVKGALFHGSSLFEAGNHSLWIITGLFILALSLAAAPFTSGAMAKSIFSSSLPVGFDNLQIAYSLAATLTVLLMSRFLYLVLTKKQTSITVHPNGSLLVWSFSIIVIVIMPFILTSGASNLTGGIIPLSIGIVLALIASRTALPSWIDHVIVSSQYNSSTTEVIQQSHEPLDSIDGISKRLFHKGSVLYDCIKSQIVTSMTSFVNFEIQKSHDPWPMAASLSIGIVALFAITLLIFH